MKEKFLFESKQELLNWLQSKPYDSFAYTAVAVYDVNGGNRQLFSESFVEFFDEDNIEYLPSDNWELVETQQADENNFDAAEWLADMPNNCADDLNGMFVVGALYIAKFQNKENGRHMDILYWPNYSFDVQFDNDTSSDCEGFNISYNDCKQWIEFNRNDKTTYFGDYKGGTVSIVCNETGEIVYSEPI